MTIISNSKLIPLSQGKHAIVDASDYDWLNQWKWHFSKRGYAERKNWNKKPTIIKMHRVVINAPDGMDVDHINGVFWCGYTERWRAVITYNDKRIHLGRFDYQEDAALAYNEAAKKYHEEFARFNEI